MNHVHGRLLRKLAALSVVTLGTSVAVALPAVAAGDPPGRIGASFTIATRQDMPTANTDHPYDIAVTPDGTAYVAWIGATTAPNDTRTVNLCTLKPGSTACEGGVQTASAVNGSSAHDMEVVATSGGAELFWEADVQGATGEIFEVVAPHGTGLSSPPLEIESVPTGSGLLDVTDDLSGNPWLLTDAGAGTRSLTVFDAHSRSQSVLKAPFGVANGQLAFAGSSRATTPVLTVTRYGGAEFVPVQYASAPGGKWTGFHKVAGTWSNGDAGLVRAGKGVRLVTGVDNASYRPVIVAWNGKGFNAPTLTSDHNNVGGTQYHDVATDPSGRVADVDVETTDLTVTAYPDGRHAAVSRQHIDGTQTYEPQIGESTRGIATVVWSREHGTSGSDLEISRFRLGTVSHTRSAASRGGHASVTGPVSCLPVSNTPVKLTVHAAKGWSVRSRTLTLNGRDLTKNYLDGAALPSGTTYKLAGHVTFAKKGDRSSSVTPTLTFRTC